MRDDVLINLVIAYLEKEIHNNLSRPRYFPAKHVADAVGGYPPAVGRTSDKVLHELRLRGHLIEYEKSGNNRRFVLLG